MTTVFNPTESVPSGLFPSAAFAVFCNRVLAVTIAAFVVKKKVRGIEAERSKDV